MTAHGGAGGRARIDRCGLRAGSATAGVAGLVAHGACVIVLLHALFPTVWLTTLRVKVWPGRLDLVWLLRRHRYPLVRGQITRVHPARRERGRLLGPMIELGIQLGPARLSGGERLTVIRLASTPNGADDPDSPRTAGDRPG